MRAIEILKNISPHQKFSILPAFILSSWLLLVSTAYPQEQTLDPLSSKAAAQIHKSVKSNGNRILVADFSDTHAKTNGLGVVLADQFADSLRKNAQGLVVIDRADFARAATEDALTPEARADAQTARCYCRQLGADFMVQGTLDAGSGDVQLGLKVTRLSDSKSVFDGTVSLPLTPELRANLPKPPRPATLTSRGAKNNRTNPDGPPDTADALRTPGMNGITFPSCIYCPAARFSDMAVKAKVQGSVLLDAVVDAQGIPASISVARGIPCGLNDKAIESVKQWRLKPAQDSNGNPVAVRQTIEVTFHLY